MSIDNLERLFHLPSVWLLEFATGRTIVIESYFPISFDDNLASTKMCWMGHELTFERYSIGCRTLVVQPGRICVKLYHDNSCFPRYSAMIIPFGVIIFLIKLHILEVRLCNHEEQLEQGLPMMLMSYL